MSTNPRVLIGRYGQHKRWGRVVDRTAETAPARSQGPGDITYWLNRLGPEFEDATDQQRLDAACSLKRAYFTKLAIASAKARKKAP
jgi:hypothetical protein